MKKEQIQNIFASVKEDVIIKDKEKIEDWILLNNFKQHRAIKKNFVPKPVLMEYDLPFKYYEVLNIISSIYFRHRVGRSVNLIVKDLNEGFVYGFITLASPMLYLQPFTDFIKNLYELNNATKTYYNIINKWTVDVTTCVGTGPLTRYLTGKLLILCALSNEALNYYDKKYNTNIEIVLTTSIYGKSSIYNRVRNIKMLGLTKGLNAAFTKDQIKWIKNTYIKFFPDRKQKVSAKCVHLIRLVDHLKQIGISFPFEIHTMQKGCYVSDLFNEKFSVKEQVEHWKERWYYPRLERIKNGLRTS